MILLTAAACDAMESGSEPIPPTATLAPIVSSTPRFTATPIPTSTPLPTQTYTPSLTPVAPTPTETVTPSPTPPILGVVASMQSVNIREGPGVTFGTIEALRPGTRVEVLGTNADGSWLNILMSDGRQGWISAALLRLQPSATPLPSLTPTPDETLLAAGTPLPTALFGGGTITPTPPRAVVTPTEIAAPASPTADPSGGVALPNIEAINRTATALVGGLSLPTPTSTISSGSSAAALPSSAGGSGQRARVFAYCDMPGDPYLPPTGLQPGATIVIFWSWYARTREQVQDHIDAATYEVFLNGRRLEYRQFQGGIEQRADGNYWVDWAVTAGPLEAGQQRITYRVSWSRPISDGYAQFGPGTATESESGTCTFNVG